MLFLITKHTTCWKTAEMLEKLNVLWCCFVRPRCRGRHYTGSGVPGSVHRKWRVESTPASPLWPTLGLKFIHGCQEEGPLGEFLSNEALSWPAMFYKNFFKSVRKGWEKEQHESRLRLEEEDELRVLRHTKRGFQWRHPTSRPRLIREERSYSALSHSLVRSGKFHSRPQCWYCNCLADFTNVSQSSTMFLTHNELNVSAARASCPPIPPLPLLSSLTFIVSGQKRSQWFVTALHAMSVWESFSHGQ